MSFLKSSFVVLLALGWANASNEPPVGSADYFRNIQQKALHNSNVFPHPGLISQRYAMKLKPTIVDHVLEMPSFTNFLNYYTNKLDTNSSIFNETHNRVKEALAATFDSLIKQYGRLNSKVDPLHDIQKRDINNDDSDLDDFLMSEAFTNELLSRTRQYLDEIDVDKTNDIVKRAINVIEAQMIENAREEAEDIAYDNLSFPNKLMLLVRDQVVDPFVEQVGTELNIIKGAYRNGGFLNAVKSLFGSKVNETEQPVEVDSLHHIQKRAINNVDSKLNDFLMSEAFANNELLSKAIQYLDETDVNKTNEIVKRAIKVIEAQMIENAREEAEDIAYDNLSFPSKLMLLVRDEVVDPFIEQVGTEFNMIKGAYKNGGVSSAVKSMFGIKEDDTEATGEKDILRSRRYAMSWDDAQ